VAIAAGGYANLALMGDGTVWQWNSLIAFGPNASQTTAPVQVSMLNGIKAIGAGYTHCLAVRKDGAVWAWGGNEYGQLGDGTTILNRETPVQVAGLNGVEAAVAGSGDTSLALRNDGTVWAWGGISFSRVVGDSSTGWLTPVQVMAPGSPDLTIAMSHQGDFAVGGQGVYTLTVTNIGLTATTGPVTVTDILPPGLAYVSGVGSGWACSAFNQTVACTNGGPTDPAASSTITLTLDVSSAAWPGVTNLATVSNASDRNVSNDVIGDPTVVGRGR
jgi:uncharacterized repeat protein (TIGR01451 family)